MRYHFRDFVYYEIDSLRLAASCANLFFVSVPMVLRLLNTFSR
ncbi:hypothetical protein HMPREF0673_01018 [Leyella stercorea DSM 18206]|uniref:Uncharacterized protein n=1 Tax=Leyella stercorea DSM 18206 TaxID=1002367 RepID=G6AWM0_9BACT|nr:hypothetical protein HMPREF0673_01018 [Leyella stercorea DSM 18206]